MSWPPLFHPAMSFQGEWGPLWAVPEDTGFCFSVRPVVASVSGLLWSLGARGLGAQRDIASLNAALLFRSVLKGGTYALFAFKSAL